MPSSAARTVQEVFRRVPRMLSPAPAPPASAPGPLPALVSASAAQARIDAQPFFVERTPAGRRLRVYRRLSYGGRRVFTLVKGVWGDVAALGAQLTRAAGVPPGRLDVRPEHMAIRIRGDYLVPVERHIESLGF